MQTKTKRKELKVVSLSLDEVADGNYVALLLCTLKANEHVCTYRKQIYALICDKDRKIVSLFWTSILMFSGTIHQLGVLHERSSVLVGCDGK